MSSSSPKAPSTAALVLAFTTIYLAWGSTYLGMKVTVATMPPFAMASARFILAGVILYAINGVRRLPSATPRQWRDNCLVGVLLLLGGNGLVAWGGQYLPSGITALLLAMSPLFMVLVEWAWPGGKRPTAMTWCGLALGLAGATLLAAPWERAAEGGLHGAGLLAIVGACVSWAVGSIFSRGTKHPPHVLVGAAVQMIGGGVALGGVAIASGELEAFSFVGISRASWIAWIYLLVIGLIGFPTYAWLIKHSTPARVSTYAYVNPVVAVFLGWLLLDEPIAARTIVSAAIVLLAAVVIKLHPAAASPASPPLETRNPAVRPAWVVPGRGGDRPRVSAPAAVRRAGDVAATEIRRAA